MAAISPASEAGLDRERSSKMTAKQTMAATLGAGLLLAATAVGATAGYVGQIHLGTSKAAPVSRGLA